MVVFVVIVVLVVHGFQSGRHHDGHGFILVHSLVMFVYPFDRLPFVQSRVTSAEEKKQKLIWIQNG